MRLLNLILSLLIICSLLLQLAIIWSTTLASTTTAAAITTLLQSAIPYIIGTIMVVLLVLYDGLAIIWTTCIQNRFIKSNSLVQNGTFLLLMTLMTLGGSRLGINLNSGPIFSASLINATPLSVIISKFWAEAIIFTILHGKLWKKPLNFTSCYLVPIVLWDTLVDMISVWYLKLKMEPFTRQLTQHLTNIMKKYALDIDQVRLTKNEISPQIITSISQALILLPNQSLEYSNKTLAAIIVHEIGHYAQRHWLLFPIISLAERKLNCLLAMGFSSLANDQYSALTLLSAYSLAGIAVAIIRFWSRPWLMWLLRRCESQADAFVKENNYGPAFIQHLKRLKLIDSASGYLNYLFNASHPPLLYRIRQLT